MAKQMTHDLVLHQKSRFSSPNRKLNAVKAIQDRDELALFALLEAYLRARSRKRAAISPKTVVRYQHALKTFFDFAWQPDRTLHLLQVQETDLEAFVETLTDRHAGTGKSALSRNTIDVTLIALKTLYKALVWSGATSRNPTDALPSLTLPKAERQPVLQPDQLRTLNTFETTTDPVLQRRNAAILELGLSTMLRANEIVALNLEDLDLQHGVIQVMGKGGKPRTLPLTSAPLEALRAWLEVRPQLISRRSSSALFLSASRRNRGQRIAYGGVYTVVRGVFATLEAGREGMKLGGMHTLRRSGATRFHARNRDIAVLAAQLGHASLTTTQRYIKLDLSALRNALEAVERLSGGDTES
jgi:integrase/recombinase XerC